MHFEAVAVLRSDWNDDSTTSVKTESAIHCGHLCKDRASEGGHRCWMFSFSDGQCQMSGWLPAAADNSGNTDTTYRTILGQVEISSPQVTSSYTLDLGITDYYMEYKNIDPATTPGVKTWQECRDLCAAKDGCKNWTWHKSNAGPLKDDCITMPGIGGKVQWKSIYISGSMGPTNCKYEDD